MIKTISTLLIILSFIPVYGQEDCETILAKEIKISKGFPEKEEFLKNFYKLSNCGLDSIDVAMYAQNMPILGMMLVETTRENTTQEKITYRDILNYILEYQIKEAEEYQKFKSFYLQSEKMKSTTPNETTWEEMQEFLQVIGITEKIIAHFQEFVKENQNSQLTYYQLFITFQQKYYVVDKGDWYTKQEYKKIEKEREKAKNQKDKNSLAFGEVKNIDIEEKLAEAKKQNKPLLLYFTAHGAANARAIEHAILLLNVIQDKILQNFIFVSLFVDDRTKLPEKEQTKYDYDGELIKTIGAKNMNLQVEKFQTNTQPFFVILNGKGETLNTFGFTRSKEDFLRFLEEGLKELDK